MESINIKKIAESGQCFRVLKINANTYRTVHKGEYVELLVDKQGNLVSYSCDTVTWNNVWAEYFDVDIIKDSLSAYSDLVLSARHYNGIGSGYINRAIEAGMGLKILKQDKWETLISYIISQRNSIKKISNTIEELCRRLGERKIDRFTGKTYYTFPDCTAIVENKDVIYNMGLGYRDEYVYLAALEVKDFGIDAFNRMDSLLSLKGVGVKVANCYRLSALHILDAFPIDVWIQRILDREFDGSTGFLKNFKGTAGILEQYMFYYERSQQGKLVELYEKEEIA